MFSLRKHRVTKLGRIVTRPSSGESYKPLGDEVLQFARIPVLFSARSLLVVVRFLAVHISVWVWHSQFSSHLELVCCELEYLVSAKEKKDFLFRNRYKSYDTTLTHKIALFVVTAYTKYQFRYLVSSVSTPNSDDAKNRFHIASAKNRFRKIYDIEYNGVDAVCTKYWLWKIPVHQFWWQGAF